MKKVGCNVTVLGNKMFKITQKLKMVKKELKEINKSGFLELQAEVIKAVVAIEDVQTKMHENSRDLQIATEELVKVHDYKAKHTSMSLLKQAKVNWLTDGDENISLFHQSIK